MLVGHQGPMVKVAGSAGTVTATRILAVPSERVRSFGEGSVALFRQRVVRWPGRRPTGDVEPGRNHPRELHRQGRAALWPDRQQGMCRTGRGREDGGSMIFLRLDAAVRLGAAVSLCGAAACGGAHAVDVLPYYRTAELTPDFDSPERLEAWASAHGIAGDGWQLLTGSRDELERLAEEACFVNVGDGSAHGVASIAHTEVARHPSGAVQWARPSRTSSRVP